MRHRQFESCVLALIQLAKSHSVERVAPQCLMCRFLSGLIDVLAFDILPGWLAWIRLRTCGRSVYFRLALRVQKEASAVAVFMFVLCATWCEEASSVVCARTVLCATAACTALAVPPPGACSDAGCAKRRLAQLIAVPPFLRVYRVPAAGPAARAELIVDAPPRFAAVGAFLA